MNIRLYNARILTMEPGREVFYGEIWVKNDISGGMGQIPVPENCLGY